MQFINFFYCCIFYSAPPPPLQAGTFSRGVVTMRCDISTCSTAHISLLVSGSADTCFNDQARVNLLSVFGFFTYMPFKMFLLTHHFFLSFVCTLSFWRIILRKSLLRRVNLFRHFLIMNKVNHIPWSLEDLPL